MAVTTYLTADEVWAINDEVLRPEGSAIVLRDRGALEGAVMRPQTRAYYEGADLIAQAATLMIGLALSHPFLDGNKRTAVIAGDVFLRLNGQRINADDIEFADELVKVVATTRDRSQAEQQFVEWLRLHVVPTSP
jgi:death-on-curing protein